MRKTGFTLAGAMLVALFVMAPSVAAAPRVVADGLFDPRGIADAPGDRLLVAQSGSGTITLIRDADGRNPRTSIFAELPDSGLVDVAASGLGRAFAVAGGAPEADGGTFGQLLRVRRGGEPNVLADIAAYQEGDPDPYDQADPPFPTESNANGLAVLGGGRFLVADAANNDLLKVDDGEITTVARFKPEAVPWPAGVPGPPPGTPFLAEAVPTAVAVGPDGAWYVSELKGFPFDPGSSRIWRIRRGAEGATCDPEQPNTGPCRTVQTGFTSVIDLAFGDDGELYVLEIAKAGLLAVEEFGAPPIGGLWRVEDGSKTELEPDELMAPGGVTVDDENIYVTTGTVFGPGAGAVVRIDAPDEDRGRGDDDD
ncbi:MAG: ScyD/ScyE family protein [Thermoleophilaceae bacterium]